MPEIQLAPIDSEPEPVVEQAFSEFLQGHPELLGGKVLSDAEIVLDTETVQPFGEELMIDVSPGTPLALDKASNSLVGQLFCNDD
ncbi:MAG TPA: hypothetical protein VNX65_03730 [Patescibacteria group bacterium]|jgi:hypothetical protein|nr:hypothetical protein [Patescibacteria group bacterium]